MKAGEIVKFLGQGELKGDPDAGVVVIDDIKGVKRDSLAFLGEASYFRYLKTTGANVIVVENGLYGSEIEEWLSDNKRAAVIIKNAYNAFIKLMCKITPELCNVSKRSVAVEMISKKANISKDAVLYPNVFIGDNVEVGKRTVIFPGVVILNDSKVGDDVVLYPNVSIYQNTTMGNRVVVGSGTVIGSDGFGFVKDESGATLKVPHIGGVIIGDDVEIGSNTSIDRGTVGNTIIKKGTKIDNLVQIAHNCIVGENNILCGMVGLSGSTELGNNVIMAANSGTKGHIKIGDNSIVTARTSVSKDLKPGSEVKGIYPARPVAEELKVQTLVGRLPEIYERLKKLEKEKRG
ncbi:MAG: UDP-3-O-(3-hydroxymyristoyl)glucosamine N-acyltransferase [Pseudomonadota bacterium]